MCGIVGYIGEKDITSILIVGLERLSYRGYDSAGISVISSNELSLWKKSGKISSLDNIVSGLTINSNIGIGHTRWATHGIVNDKNSHPHLSSNKKFSIVHNGIIENYAVLKTELTSDGYIFRSQTDSEVIAHLLEKYYVDDVEKALYKTIQRLKGSFAVCVISEHDSKSIYFARQGSPLILGVGQNENYISSDINSILPHTKKVVYLDDNRIGRIDQTGINVKDFNDQVVNYDIKEINWNPEQSEKQGYDHFMLKEIYEQPSVVRKIISKYIDTDQAITFKNIGDFNFLNTSRFLIQACGTSWHSGLIGKFYIEQFARILTDVDISSEFRYRRMISQGNDIVLAISQSGETADTLAGIRQAKANFFRVLSFVNVKNSSIVRESDGVVYSHSGQEIGVASTKNFISQLVSIFLFSLHLGFVKGELSDKTKKSYITMLQSIPEYIESILAQQDYIEQLADKYYMSNQFLFIGRGMNYPSALEGALKLKEISYIHATGYAAGELKHGPLALIDSKLPVVCICPKSETYDKMFSNIQEVRSRKGKTIVIATEGDKKIKEIANDIIYIPEVCEELSPILTSIPLQLLAYFVAIKRDCNVDQPRNLAKSVTVE